VTSYVLAVDVGTTGTRAILFTHDAKIFAVHHEETTQSFPEPGHVEQDPDELWEKTRACVEVVLSKISHTSDDVVAVGVTTQRETVIAWDKESGLPLAPAIVWQDTRTQEWLEMTFDATKQQRITELTGLPVTAYFSASKMRWLLDNCADVAAAAEAGNLAFGTPDSWIAWNLTGGAHGGRHITDVTNASRTMLMNIETLSWSDELITLFNIPRATLPEITSSTGDLAVCGDLLRGAPLTCILGDQQAAAFGQATTSPGDAKTTYGTGNFLLINTGTLARSAHGLISTVAYQLADHEPVYALEGSVAVSGSLVQWLRDNLHIIEKSADVETLATSVDDSGDVYFVPAFSGLFAPYWKPDARGTIVGLTRFSTKAHIARAALESTAFQTRDVIDAAEKDTGIALHELRVDGGMVSNDFLMQFQADIANIPVVRPVITETTALGAAFGAGLAVGFWKDTRELETHWIEDRRWEPSMTDEERHHRISRWQKAVSKSIGWLDD
jgi:glycerol kinase